MNINDVIVVTFSRIYYLRPLKYMRKRLHFPSCQLLKNAMLNNALQYLNFFTFFLISFALPVNASTLEKNRAFLNSESIYLNSSPLNVSLQLKESFPKIMYSGQSTESKVFIAELILRFPEDYGLNMEAPSKITAHLKNKNGATIALQKVQVKEAFLKITFPLEAPLEEGMLELNGSIYYCKKEKGALCKLYSLERMEPFKNEKNSESEEAVLKIEEAIAG
jgi:hypothetical protein